MTNDFLPWGAIFFELIGLFLVTIELYFPKASGSLKAFFEETKPKIIRNSVLWVGSYIFIWVITTIALSIWGQSMNLKANVFFTLITVLVLLVFGVSKTLVRLGVVLGRGNSVGALV
jgi:hypothetical protein